MGDSDAPPAKTWYKLFADTLLDKDAAGRQVPVSADEVLRGKHVAIYFSAHWCPPCRAFTPQLAKTYSKLHKDGRELAVVFVSMDRSQEQFDEYFATMPWYAVPYRDDQLRSVLSRKFSVQGIPCLVMLAPDSTILSVNARSAVMADPNGDNFPWEGAKEPRAFPIQWMLLVFLAFWLINTVLFPPKPKT